MDLKWTLNGPQMDLKWTSNGPKIDTKRDLLFKMELKDVFFCSLGRKMLEMSRKNA